MKKTKILKLTPDADEGLKKLSVDIIKVKKWAKKKYSKSKLKDLKLKDIKLKDVRK